MGYYVRAFCTSPEVPCIKIVLADLQNRGLAVRAEVDDEAKLVSADWSQFDLFYKPDKKPVVVECNRDDGDESLCRKECNEFIEEIHELDDTPSRDRVIGHLKRTTFVVVCQLLSDIDDDGYTANGEFLAYFVRHCGGLVQADGEGFYEGDEITLDMG